MAPTLRRTTRLTMAATSAAAAAAVGLASTVFACTTIMAQMNISPSSGPGATVVTTSVASGLKPNATYAIQFTKGLSTAGADCMGTAVTKLKTVTTNTSGGWSNKTVKIPAAAKKGAHGVCGMEQTPVKGQTGTTHETFTVV